MRSPSDARKEIAEVKEQLKEFNAYKTEHKFLSKRDRLMRTAWKHGVHGFDDADSKHTECFYSENRDKQLKRQQDKDYINKKRANCKLFCTKSLICFRDKIGTWYF